jgi:hypothetical protein
MSENSNIPRSAPGILSEMQTTLFIVLFAMAGAIPGAAQDKPFTDDLLDHLAGTWKMTGQIQGQPVTHTVSAGWMLNHQFLHVHEKDAAVPPAYEVEIYVGYDSTSERYVVHWLDVFGGRLSETLGYGKREGNSIRFVFEYPDGPFTNTFAWKPELRKWQWVLETKNKDGKWTNFATLDLSSAP